MFEQRLVEMVNSGRCLALVGAGLSREIGYPDWRTLAEKTVAAVRKAGKVADEDSYSRYFADKSYPELFSQAERDLGSRQELERIVASLLDFTPCTLGSGYKYLAKWPFACYLTTNFDDEILRHLRDLNVEFAIAHNTSSDLASLRSDTQGFIYKLHSDFTLPGTPTLTSADYRRLYVSGEGEYYRNCLRAVFQKFNLIVVGYSLADPDVSHILDLAREGASPAHPIYMIGPRDDFSDADEQEYRERYNIRLLRYANPDGCHQQLRRTLETYDCFIQPRCTSAIQREITQEEVQESLDALSLYLHRHLSDTPMDQAIAPLVLAELHSAAAKYVSPDELANGALQRFLKGAPDAVKIVRDSLEMLRARSDVEVHKDDDRYRLSAIGGERHERVIVDARGMKDRAFGQFKLAMRQHYRDVTEREEANACAALESAVTTAFSEHSSAIVNTILSDEPTTAHEGIALFGDIRDAATNVLNGDAFNAYMMGASDFLFYPEHDQKRYLASLSQGFFLAHLLGRDPRFRRIRSETLRETAWLVDSSILIPLIAQGSELSNLADSLFSNLNDLDVFVFTTDMLLRELWQHFKWARDQIEKAEASQADALYSCVMSDKYKPNVFLEGYASFAAREGSGRFGDYVLECFGKPPSLSALEERLAAYGVVTVRPGGYVTNIDELEEWKLQISQARWERHTLRSDFQVEAEAEAYWAIQNYETIAAKHKRANISRAYFVSHSPVLNDIAARRVTWLPESLFRYLSGLPEVRFDDDAMQQCVLETILASHPIVTERKFLELFGRKIDIAKYDLVATSGSR